MLACQYRWCPEDMLPLLLRSHFLHTYNLLPQGTEMWGKPDLDGVDAQAVWDDLDEGCPAGSDQHLVRPQVQRQAALAEDVRKGVDELRCQKLLQHASTSFSTECAGFTSEDPQDTILYQKSLGLAGSMRPTCQPGPLIGLQHLSTATAE